MSDCRCFVINLARSTTRYHTIQQQLDQQDVPFERIDAVDGAALTREDISHWYNDEVPRHYHKQLNAGEIGCFLSHRRAWQTIVERQIPYAVILEDDINLIGNINRIIGFLDTLPDDWDYIKLAEHSRRRKVIHEQRFASFTRVTYNKVPARTCAQAVSLEGAKKLLLASESIVRPVDIDLQYWWEKDLRVFGIQPYPVEPGTGWDSEIDKTRNRSTARKDPWLKIRMLFAFAIKNSRANRHRLRELNAPASKLDNQR